MRLAGGDDHSYTPNPWQITISSSVGNGLSLPTHLQAVQIPFELVPGMCANTLSKTPRNTHYNLTLISVTSALSWELLQISTKRNMQPEPLGFSFLKLQFKLTLE